MCCRRRAPSRATLVERTGLSREQLDNCWRSSDREEQSLRTVAVGMGLSAERVRQVEKRALGKLAAAAGVAGDD